MTFCAFQAFKYLADKPRAAFEGSSQFLQILAAEADLLVTVSVHLPPRAASSLEEGLGRLYTTDYTSAVAQQWNDLRREVLHTALNHHLLPAAGKWMRDFLKEEQEEFVLRQCGESLEQVRSSSSSNRLSSSRRIDMLVPYGSGLTLLRTASLIWNGARFRQ